ncbi:hypothetical protein V8C86DRAFT_2525913 [Haematococcus lacustris]
MMSEGPSPLPGAAGAARGAPAPEPGAGCGEGVAPGTRAAGCCGCPALLRLRGADLARLLPGPPSANTAEGGQWGSRPSVAGPWLSGSAPRAGSGGGGYSSNSCWSLRMGRLGLPPSRTSAMSMNAGGCAGRPEPLPVSTPPADIAVGRLEAMLAGASEESRVTRRATRPPCRLTVGLPQEGMEARRENEDMPCAAAEGSGDEFSPARSRIPAAERADDSRAGELATATVVNVVRCDASARKLGPLAARALRPGRMSPGLSMTATGDAACAPTPAARPLTSCTLIGV